MAAKRLTLWHVLPCRSARVVHLIEELSDVGIEAPIDVNKLTTFDPAELNKPEYLELNPMATLPVLTCEGGTAINESCGILLYLLKFFGKGELQPADDDYMGWATFLNWIFRAETTLAAPLDRWIVNSGKTFVPRATCRPEVAEAAMHQALKGYKVLDDALEGKEWLVNNTFSAADIAVGYSAGFWAAMSPHADMFANVMAYNNRVMSRPAAQRTWAGFHAPDMAMDAVKKEMNECKASTAATDGIGV